VKTVYANSFVKDLKRLRATPVFERIKMLAFDTIPRADTLAELASLKQLQQAKNAYRIRVGDYRLGFVLEHDTVIIKRVLHRKDIYRYFP
jgi:mRNA interferase RelE/StbE